jgi:hypothetical protein
MAPEGRPTGPEEPALSWIPGAPHRLLLWMLFGGVYLPWLLEIALLEGPTGLRRLLDAYALQTAGPAYWIALGIWTFLAILPALVPASRYQGPVRGLVLGEGRAVFVGRYPTVDLPVAALRPVWLLPRWGRALLEARLAEPPRCVELWVTRKQARAIMTEPGASAALFPSRYWTWIGSPYPPYWPSIKLAPPGAGVRAGA